MHNKFDDSRTRSYEPLRKFRNFAKGMRFAVLHDYAVAYKLVLAVIIPSAFFLLELPHSLLILLATAVMLMAEMFNTTIEALCDYVQPENDPKIGIVKDMAAASTGIAILVWLAIVIFEVVQIVKYVRGLWILSF